jgi:hypothetical protein
MDLVVLSCLCCLLLLPWLVCGTVCLADGFYCYETECLPVFLIIYLCLPNFSS